eukprot:jgi/Chlat1/761/Chrsp104S01234
MPPFATSAATTTVPIATPTLPTSTTTSGRVTGASFPSQGISDATVVTSATHNEQHLQPQQVTFAECCTSHRPLMQQPLKEAMNPILWSRAVDSTNLTSKSPTQRIRVFNMVSTVLERHLPFFNKCARK